ncbi:hypothetical protein A9Q81_17425 [Gammaproteobacteria bacterium 42_54_T18]|nr:hypothetical protein A9Q81_17425 [Gammaproteobacteria bacterium 42_54_T18]
MKKPLSAVALLLVGSLLSWLLLTMKEKPVPQPVVNAATPVVDIVYAQPATHQLYVHTQGTVQPAKEIDVVTQVSGIVEAIAPEFANGAFFQKGQHLLNIEDADYRFALIRAEANVAEAEQVLAVERARAAQAVREWRDLGQEDANALSLRKPQLASARAKLRAAEAGRDEAQLNLDRTHVKAPFNGRVRMKYVDEGQYVSLGTPIVKLYSTDKVEVRLPITDKQLALLDLPTGRVRQGRVTQGSNLPTIDFEVLFAGNIQHWEGTLVRTEATVDIKTRVVYAIAEIVDPFSISEGRAPLNVGMFVNATISGKALDSVIRLPRNALQIDQKILVLNEDNDIQIRRVDVLQTNKEHVLLTGDIKSGDRIVISNIPMAVSGMRVSPRKIENSSAINIAKSEH